MATALAFAREGAGVVIDARRVREGKETVGTIAEACGKALFLKTDLSKPPEVQALVMKTIEIYVWRIARLQQRRHRREWARSTRER